MDVKCERCNTEYEFDDALVSGRGTTVKCTNCGHKFKIRRSDGDFSEDFWNVTTGDGRTLVFTSLRELQRAIQGYLVERNDRLSRGGLPPKAIGQIPELAPFFDQREAAKKSQQPQRSVKTHDGLGPSGSPPAPPARPRQPTKPEFPAPPGDLPVGKSTLIGTGPVSEEEAIPAMRAQPPPAPPLPRPPPPVPAAAPPPPPVRARESMSTVPLKRPTLPPPVPQARPATVSMPPPLPDRARRPEQESPRPSEQVRARPPVPEARAASDRPSVSEQHAAAPTPSVPMVDVSSPLPVPRVHRSLLAEIEEDRDRARGPSASIPDGPPSRRRSVGGFIVAAVVVGCALMLGAVWAQKNLGVTLGTKPPPATPTVDPRVATFLAAGEKALADGNFELAKESFDKASALSEKEPHVLLGLARLSAVRADVFWLKSRLLAPDAADDHRITRDSLTDLAAAARKAADDALAVAPDDPAALRAKIDALRISGDRDGARALVAKITTSSTQPESAYVLAALDLAETEPLWPTVVERLKIASSAETGPGRARAALVYALARSGDVPSAKAEVERLNGMAKAHPLLPFLRAFADRSKASSPKLDGGAPALIATTTASAPIAVDAADAGKVAPAGTGGKPAGLPSDARELVAQGEKARAKGDYERARTLFSAAVDKNPNDSEALAGLAAIAYAQHDLNGARTSFKRVLAINPNYMPALVGLADVEWDSGDKAAATKMYKDIIDRYPEGAYPGRVKLRVEGG